MNRIDMLMLAMHEIGHALGLDNAYSGLIKQGGGNGLFTIKPRARSPASTSFLEMDPISAASHSCR